MTKKPVSKKVLSKTDILGAKDRQYAEVDVSEWWGGEVRIQSLTAAELFAFQKEVKQGKDVDEEQAFSLLCVRSIVDDVGHRMFNDDELPTLMGKGFQPLRAISNEALKLNGMREEDVVALAGK